MVKPRRAYHTLERAAAGPTYSQEAPYAPEVPYVPHGGAPVQVPMGGAGYGPLGGMANLHVSEPVPPRQQYQTAPLASSATDAPRILSFGSNTQEPVPVLPHERIIAQQTLGVPPLFKTSEHTNPPLGDTSYQVIDQGISGPDFLRMSMYNVPASAKLREATKLPLAVMARPFARAEVPIADFSQDEPPRCARCRTFMNPSMQFASGGSKFVCNMCQFVNRTPDYYFEQTDATGRRIDWQSRPELSVGTYDMELPPSYGTGSKLRHLFAIDTSRDSVKKGLVHVAAEAIRQALYGLDKTPGEGCLLPDTQVAIVAFHQSIIFFRFNASGQLEMLQDNNLQDPVVPPDLFVNPEEAFEGMSSLLDNLPNLFPNAPNHSCFGTLLKVGQDALGEAGGRISAICTTFPSMAPGKLVRRDSGLYTPPSNTQADSHQLAKELFLPTATWYTDMAKEYSKCGIGFDLFAFPTGYSDLTNFGFVAQASGGRHLVYPQYVGQRDARAFMVDFVEACAEPLVATQTALKFRTSNGLQIEKVWAPELGLMDSATNVLATIVYDGSLDPKLDVHVQCAVLYTTPWGTRRLRVCNIVSGVTDMFKAVLRFVDSDVVVAAIARQTTAQMFAKPLAMLRTAIVEKIREIFTAARTNSGTNMPSGYLVVPTQLRPLLPMSLALIKCPAFSPRTYMSDSRTHSARLIERMTVAQLSLYLYPRIYPVHELFDVQDGIDLTTLPMLEAKLSALSTGGCYLIFNGLKFLLFVTSTVPPALVRDLLGAESLDQVSPYLDELPVLDSDISRHTRELCAQLAEHVGRPWCPLQLAREGLDGAEHSVVAHMIEDGAGGPSYSDYIQKIYRAN